MYGRYKGSLDVRGDSRGAAKTKSAQWRRHIPVQRGFCAPDVPGWTRYVHCIFMDPVCALHILFSVSRFRRICETLMNSGLPDLDAYVSLQRRTVPKRDMSAGKQTRKVMQSLSFASQLPLPGEI